MTRRQGNGAAVIDADTVPEPADAADALERAGGHHTGDVLRPEEAQLMELPAVVFLNVTAAIINPDANPVSIAYPDDTGTLSPRQAQMLARHLEVAADLVIEHQKIRGHNPR